MCLLIIALERGGNGQVTFAQLPGAAPATPAPPLFEEVKGGGVSRARREELFAPASAEPAPPFNYEEQKGADHRPPPQPTPPSRQSAKAARQAPDPSNPFGSNMQDRHNEEQVIPALRNKDGPFIPPGG